MTDILFIQSIRKSNHFRFLVLCNLPPLRFTTILGHLIKCVLKPFEMSRQHLQTKQKNYRCTAGERNEDKGNKRDQGKKIVYFPLADSLIVAEVKVKILTRAMLLKFQKHFNNKKKFRSNTIVTLATGQQLTDPNLRC